jgi:hypothetical protein
MSRWGISIYNCGWSTSIYNCGSIEKETINLQEKVMSAFKDESACELTLERVIKVYQETTCGKVLEADGVVRTKVIGI